MQKVYILAHDLGTSGNKATLFNTQGKLTASCVHAYGTSYAHPRWAEQNPEDWWQAICGATSEIIAKSGIKPGEIACISFSAQMMGCLLLDAQGKPLRPMITWADTRAQAQEAYMLKHIGAQKGYQITGHRLSASYSAAKLLWVKQNEPEVYRKAAKMVHAKDYIIYKLTGEIISDFSDASGTNLLDIQNKCWSAEIIETLGIPKQILPELFPSSHVAGYVSGGAAAQCGLLQGTPVVLGGGDGSCACVGAGVVKAGTAYNVIGTSSWVSTAAPSPYYDDEMRTFNWVHLDPSLYTPCGTMQAAGLSYKWYRNTLCGQEQAAAQQQKQSVYAYLDAQAKNAPAGAGGLLFLPYLIGERSPLWNHDARGAFIGLDIATTKQDITRAVLEGVGYNLRIILEILESNTPLQAITVIGGGAKSKVWLQILADIWQKPLLLPAYLEEATSMGAAVCAGVGVGLFENYSVIEQFNAPVAQIKPNPANRAVYNSLYQIFQAAYTSIKPVYTSLAAFKQANQ